MAQILIYTSNSNSDVANTFIADFQKAFDNKHDSNVEIAEIGSSNAIIDSLVTQISADVFIVVLSDMSIHSSLFGQKLFQLDNYSSAVKKLVITVVFDELDKDTYWETAVPLNFRSNENLLKISNYNPENISETLTAIDQLIDKHISLRAYLKKAEEIKINIENETPKFIDNATVNLKERAKVFRETAGNYFTGGFAVIAIGIIVGVIIYINDKKEIAPKPELFLLIFFFIKSLVILSLIFAISSYCFKLGKSYMHEALKIEDRLHAIAFGQLYLNIYKEGLRPEDVKEVFSDWNISINSTAFMNNANDDWDPKVLEKMLDIIGKVKDASK